MASTGPQEQNVPASRVVDLHHHWLPRELVDRMEVYVIEGFRVERRDDGAVGVYGPSGVEELTVDPERWCRPEVQLAELDVAGMDVALLSAACYPTWLSLRAARLLNDAAADLQRAHPTRFVAMAHVPPFGENGGLAELERAARDLGLRGVCITTNFRGHYPGDEEYLPFLRKAAELDMPVFVHAAGAPVEHHSLLEHRLYRSLGRSFDHCLVTVRLLYSGLLEDLPGLRLVMPHLGGGFYAQARRFLDVPKNPSGPRPDIPYRGLLDQLLFDTAPSFAWSPLEIGWAIAGLGPTHVALGSDYPVRNDPKVLVDAVAHVRGLAVDAADRDRVAGRNALAFYGLAG